MHHFDNQPALTLSSSAAAKVSNFEVIKQVEISIAGLRDFAKYCHELTESPL